MSNKAAATFALAIAGSFITAVFAYLFVRLEGPLWIWCILASAACTIGGLMSAATAKNAPEATPPAKS